jgi:membrane fusion protein, multidrug efflux system
MRYRIKIALLCIILVGLVCLATSCKNNANNAGAKEQEEKAAIPVEVAKVERGSVTASYSGTTTLEAENEAVVVSKVNGVIQKIYVEEGDRIKAGQVLAKIEDDQFKYELAQADAKLNKLAREFERSKQLFATKIVGEEEYERVKSDYETQQSLYDIAKLNLTYTTIKAPIDGAVSERMIKVGNMVTANQSLFRISDFDTLWAILHVPEKELSKLKVGYPANLSADALEGKEYEGTILRISPTIAAGTGTFRVTIEIKDKTGELKPGMFVRANIVYDTHTNVILVPKDAILAEDIQNSVFVIKEKMEEIKIDPKKKDKGQIEQKPEKYLAAVKQPVVIGFINSSHVEVLSGVKQGERIVTTGINTLKDGAKIKIVKK